eukprot:g2242.t1
MLFSKIFLSDLWYQRSRQSTEEWIQMLDYEVFLEIVVSCLAVIIVFLVFKYQSLRNIQMGNTNDRNDKKQLLVYFNVGGFIFRILRGTIERYPRSLLGKLIEEFPNLGYESCPVFIDRSPKAFEWILEIYRNGHYDSCIPNISKEALVRELDFYQLPGMADLGLLGLGCLDNEIKEASKQCGRLLTNELTRLDLWKSLPLYACFYKRENKETNQYDAEKVLISHTCSSEMIHGVPHWFQEVITVLQSSSFRSCSNPWIQVQAPNNGNRYLIRNVRNPQIFSLLECAALAYSVRLQVPPDSDKAFTGALLVSTAVD